MRLTPVGLAVALCACGRVGFDPLDAAFGTWSTPGWMGAALNTPSDDSDPTVTADELELYFSSNRPGGIGMTDIYRSVRSDRASAWETPFLVAVLCSTALDDSPEIAADGLTLWLTSSRGGGQDVYVATRTSRAIAFSAPVLEPGLSGGFDDANVAISGDGLVAVIEHTDVTGTRWELYQHRRASTAGSWGPELHLAELSTEPTAAHIDSGPTLDATGRTIWFNSNRAGVAGEYDIFVATRSSPDAAFDAPQPVPEFNSPDSEGNLFLSPDGHTAYMHSDRPGGLGLRDLWFSTR